MGSFSGICEIIEAKEEHNSVQNSKGSHRKVAHDKSKKSLLLNLGSDNSVEDDINRLFESINIKTSSKVLILSDQLGARPSSKNSLKKPAGVGVPRSPAFGFSEPVSMKQALRGLCISQASEMAALKRLYMQIGPPRVSEAGKIACLYRSVVVDSGESSTSINEVNRGGLEISLVPKESTADSSEKSPQHLPAPQNGYSFPRFDLVTTETEKGSALIDVTTEIRSQTSKTDSAQDQKRATFSSVSGQNRGENVKNILKPMVKSSNRSAHYFPHFALTATKMSTMSPIIKNEMSASTEVESRPPSELLQEQKIYEVSSSFSCHSTHGSVDPGNIPGSTRLGNKVSAPNLMWNGRLQTVPSLSNAIKSSKGSKPMRKAPHLVKPVRNKPIVEKNLKQGSTSVSSSYNINNESSSALDLGTGQLLCQRCQCTLKNVTNKTNEDSPASNRASVSTDISSPKMNPDASKPSFASNNSIKIQAVVEKTNKNIKATEKGDFSQSSKSSLGENCSSTSIGEESNLSGSSCGNRPHMSKDLRWEAIHYARKQHGFLGLSHFNLLKKLGSGDVGMVYLAELIGTNCLFAIKVMDIEFLARRKKMPRAQTEREIMQILDHPFLPTLFAQFTSDNLLCLVMEYCPGGDLHVLRQRQQLGRHFPEQAARFYVAEVLLALEYLHMLGVVYRDLKPENILVREDGHIMLTDFDLSLRCTVRPTLLKSSSLSIDPPKMSGPCTESSCIDPFCIEPSCQVACFSPMRFPAAAKARKLKAGHAVQVRSLPQLVAEPTDARSNSFVGTHEYLAPEIIKGEGHGSAVDWWTFGIFLYELLYGKTPFKGTGNEETLANVVLQSLEFPESPLVSFQAKDLIQGLLVKEPENRLGSERGAAEIKQHPFFDGLNWALIRCASPPQLPEVCDVGIKNVASPEENQYLEYGPAGEPLEFELF